MLTLSQMYIWIYDVKLNISSGFESNNLNIASGIVYNDLNFGSEHLLILIAGGLSGMGSIVMTSGDI